MDSDSLATGLLPGRCRYVCVAVCRGIAKYVVHCNNIITTVFVILRLRIVRIGCESLLQPAKKIIKGGGYSTSYCPYLLLHLPTCVLCVLRESLSARRRLPMLPGGKWPTN